MSNEEFVALVWARDVVGSTNDGGELEVGSMMREVLVGGTKVFVIGKEFPLLKVVLTGYVVGVEQKENVIIYHCWSTLPVIFLAIDH